MSPPSQSDGGREWIRARVSSFANRGLRGRMHVGRLSGTFLTDLTVDSLELRDPDDSVYIATGPLSLRYDPRDLIDGRLVFRGVDVRNPLMIVRRELDGQWNFRKIFPVEDESTQPVILRPRGTFGALVVLHNIRMQGGEVQLTKPWHPDDSLKGPRRDSAIAVGLADRASEIRRVTLRGRHGFQKTWRWADMSGVISRLRFRHPDSTGRQFDFASMNVNETAPPFDFREMRGTALWRGL